MKYFKLKNKILILFFTLIITMFFGVFLVSQKVNALDSSDIGKFRVEEGASLRLTKTESINDGLRFRIVMDAKTVGFIVDETTVSGISGTDAGDQIKLYIVIAPSDLIKGNDFSAIEKDKWIEVDESKIYLQNGNYYVNGVLSNVKEANRMRNFVARGVIFDGTDYIWSEVAGTERSIYQVVNSALLDKNADYGEEIFTAETTYKDWYGTEKYPVKVETEDQLKALIKDAQNDSYLQSLSLFVKEDVKQTSTYTTATAEQGVLSEIKTELEKNYYSVTFKNGDDVIFEYILEEGKTPSYLGWVNPTKQVSEDKIYIFDKWDIPFEPITGDVVYNAQYISKNLYNVVFKNGEDIVDSYKLAEGEIPTFTKSAPTKTDDKNSYTFTGWDKQFSAITGDIVFNAQFTVKDKLDKFTFVNAYYKTQTINSIEKEVLAIEGISTSNRYPYVVFNNQYTLEQDDAITFSVYNNSSVYEYTFEVAMSKVATTNDDFVVGRIIVEPNKSQTYTVYASDFDYTQYKYLELKTSHYVTSSGQGDDSNGELDLTSLNVSVYDIGVSKKSKPTTTDYKIATNISTSQMYATLNTNKDYIHGSSDNYSFAMKPNSNWPNFTLEETRTMNLRNATEISFWVYNPANCKYYVNIALTDGSKTTALKTTEKLYGFNSGWNEVVIDVLNTDIPENSAIFISSGWSTGEGGNNNNAGGSVPNAMPWREFRLYFSDFNFEIDQSGEKNFLLSQQIGSTTCSVTTDNVWGSYNYSLLAKATGTWNKFATVNTIDFTDKERLLFHAYNPTNCAFTIQVGYVSSYTVGGGYGSATMIGTANVLLKANGWTDVVIDTSAWTGSQYLCFAVGHGNPNPSDGSAEWTNFKANGIYFSGFDFVTASDGDLLLASTSNSFKFTINTDSKYIYNASSTNKYSLNAKTTGTWEQFVFNKAIDFTNISAVKFYVYNPNTFDFAIQAGSVDTLTGGIANQNNYLLKAGVWTCIIVDTSTWTGTKYLAVYSNHGNVASTYHNPTSPSAEWTAYTTNGFYFDELSFIYSDNAVISSDDYSGYVQGTNATSRSKFGTQVNDIATYVKSGTYSHRISFAGKWNGTVFTNINKDDIPMTMWVFNPNNQDIVISLNGKNIVVAKGEWTEISLIADYFNTDSNFVFTIDSQAKADNVTNLEQFQYSNCILYIDFAK